MLSIVFLILNSCSDDRIELVDKLPNATQSGEENFACILDDEAWMADNAGYTAKKLHIIYDESGTYIHGPNSLKISALKVSEWGFRRERINILLEPVNNEGLINWDELDSISIKYSLEIQSPDEERIEKEFFVKDFSNARISITKLDTVENICSGEFNFKLVNPEDSLDIISISNGWFDDIYRSY